MRRFKAFILKNKVAISVCTLMAILGFGYWVLGNPGTTTIGEDITVGNDLIVNGNVGIGTTNPGAKLEVAGQIKITGGSPGEGKVLTSDATGLASWQTPPGGGGVNFVTFTPSISYSDCIQYANYNTWGTIYPTAVAAGYELSQCVPLTTFPGSGGYIAGGWIATDCWSPYPSCSHCYLRHGRAYFPGPTDTWDSPVNWHVESGLPYVGGCRITPIRCLK